MTAGRQSEMDVAADVVRRLIGVGVIPNDRHVIGRALAAIELTPEDIQEAGQRARGQWHPPSRQRFAGAKRSKFGPKKTDPSSFIAITGYVEQLKGEPATKVCNTCKRELPIIEFIRTQAGYVRKDGTMRYRRKPKCRSCINEKSRQVYMSVKQREGLAAVGLEFTANEDLVCVCCGLTISEGSQALGVAVVVHETCRDRVIAEGAHGFAERLTAEMAELVAADNATVDES